MIGWLSPLSLMLVCWGGTALVTLLTISFLDALPLVQLFMAREQIDIRAFTPMGAWWLLAGLLTYAVTDQATKNALPRLKPFRPALPLGFAAKLTFLANLVLLGITCLWIAVTALQNGGLIAMALASYSDSLGIRDQMLENKLFTGMRLFYAALPATGCLAAALLAAGALPPREKLMCQVTLALNTVALFVLPIVMSQRLLLLQFLLSAYIAACLTRGRFMGVQWLFIGAVLFLGLWAAREAITNPMLQHSALGIAGQKLAFYVVNDMWNSFAPLSASVPHTHGALTFEGLMFLSLTDQFFLDGFAAKQAQLDPFLGGGEFPFFASAYVDFGVIGGACLIAVFAALIRLAYHKGRQSLGWAAIYAQIGAALLFSSHSVYVAHQNLLFSLLLISAICRAARRETRSAPLVRAPPEPEKIMFRTRRPHQEEPVPLPDSLMRYLAVFRTRRSKQVFGRELDSRVKDRV